MSKKVVITEFQAHSVELIEELVKTHEEVVVMKDGKPVAKMVPVESVPIRRGFEEMRGSVKILGDIVSPIMEWEARE